MFQSAPPTGVRGDTACAPSGAPAYREFQSAPPTGVRGDPSTNPSSPAHRRVSIRSPHRSEGRSNNYTIQSTSTDVSIRSRLKFAFVLPVLFLIQSTSTDVSIRSPHRSEGRYRRSSYAQ